MTFGRNFLSLRCFIPAFLCALLVVSCDTQPTQVDDGEPPFSHTLNPGTSAEAFILGERFTNLIVEIQYMAGYRPAGAALDSLKLFLETHLDKVEVIIPEPRQIPSGERNSYTANQIRSLEQEHREHFSEEGTLASYNIFVDGAFDQANVLGIAYYNTSNAFFGRTIHQVSGSPPLSPPREKIEAIVMRHEYGHLMGLVNIGVDMQQEHQQNGAHCSKSECVMYATVNTADFFSNLFDQTILDLDEFCRNDIGALRESP